MDQRNTKELNTCDSGTPRNGGWSQFKLQQGHEQGTYLQERWGCCQWTTFFLDSQRAKRWNAEVCTRERACPWGRQKRRRQNWPQMCLAGEGLGMLRRGERGKPVGEKENVLQPSFRAGAAKLHAYRGPALRGRSVWPSERSPIWHSRMPTWREHWCQQALSSWSSNWTQLIRSSWKRVCINVILFRLPDAWRACKFL